MEQDRRTLLNSRDEVITKCFHKRRHKLEVYNGKETETTKKANADKIEEKEEGQGNDWNKKDREEEKTEGNKIKVKWREGEEEIEDLGDRGRIAETREERTGEIKGKEKTRSEEVPIG